jgi:hypothetical protein
MESIENRLFDLIEIYSFEALSEDDRLFVLSNLTEAEFRAQQKVLVAADQLVYPKVVPLPLALPAKKAGFLLAPIPLYKSLIGAAAAALLVFFMWPSRENTEKIVYVKNDQPVDTVFRTKIKHDTIFREKQAPLLAVNGKKPDTVYLYQENSVSYEQPRMLKATNSISLPELNEAQIKTKGKSLKEEAGSELLIKMDDWFFSMNKP